MVWPLVLRWLCGVVIVGFIIAAFSEGSFDADDWTVVRLGLRRIAAFWMTQKEQLSKGLFSKNHPLITEASQSLNKE